LKRTLNDLSHIPPLVHFGNARASPRARSTALWPRELTSPPPCANQTAHLSPPAIRRCSLPVVAASAKRLPIRLIPEKSGITLMRNNVVHDRRSREPFDSLAFDAKRMQGEVALPGRPPLGVIAPPRSRSAPLVALFAFLNTMSLTASMSRIYHHRAARKPARMRRCKRTHAALLFAPRITIAVRSMGTSSRRPRGSRPSSIKYTGRFCSW